MSLFYAILFAVLTLAASLSPLLTFTRLWQMKEWRFDRLREHLRENGWYRQLFGALRPPLTAFLLIFSGFRFWYASDGILIGLFVLACLSLLQIVLRKQPLPVWTTKAKAIMTVSGLILILDIVGCFALTDRYFPEWHDAVTLSFLIVPLIAPLYVLVAWALLRPVDAWLKHRILRRAERLRTLHPHLTVIGITGSVGKTTTKELLAHLLKSKDAVATPEHVNTEMGVAAWMTRVLRHEPPDASKILIVEMGAYRRGEIALLCRMTRPRYGIITYVGDQHMALFGSREAIIEAKGELFAALPVDGRAFASSDHAAFSALKKRCVCPVTAVGTGGHADVRALDVEETSKGLRFRALDTQFEVPIRGTHGIGSVLLAIATAKELGVPMKDIAKRLSVFESLRGTFEVKTVGFVTLLDDTYNSSPASVRAAIAWAKTQPHTTKTLVLEGIIELGTEESRIHQELAAEAKDVFDRVLVTHARHLAYFQEAFGNQAMLAGTAAPVQPGSLLVCVGRMSETLIQRLLPSSR